MKTKFKITSLLLAATLLAPALSLAHAEVSVETKVGTPKLETIKDRVLQKMQKNIGEGTTTGTSTASSTKERKDERKDERRDKVEDGFRGRLSQFMDNIVERYNAAIERLEKLSLRIDSRIKKNEAEGVDESQAKSLLVTANLKINAAKIAVANMQTISSTTLSSTTTVKMNFPAVKDAVFAGKDAIKAAHAALVEVVKNIKPGKNKATSTATTTED